MIAPLTPTFIAWVSNNPAVNMFQTQGRNLHLGQSALGDLHLRKSWAHLQVASISTSPAGD